MNEHKKNKPQERDSSAVTVTHDASRPRLNSTTVPVWRTLRGGSGATPDDTAKDALCGTTNVGGYIKAKLGDNAAATSAPELHKRQSSRRKRTAVTCQDARIMAESKRDQYLEMANRQAAKSMHDGDATISSSDAYRLLADMAKILADAIEDITDVDPALRAKVAKKMREGQRKGYAALSQISKGRGGVLPNHATAYIPGERFWSAVKAYQGLSNIAAKAVKLIAKLERASGEKAA